jgi:pantoate--beta-alanine ligase
MVADLSFPLTVKVVPTIREKEGLALSSRNILLSELEKNKALILIESLNLAKNELLDGRDWLAVRKQIMCAFGKEPLAKLEYFELIDPETFQIFHEFDRTKKSSICVASFIGNVRLIDNISIIP